MSETAEQWLASYPPTTADAYRRAFRSWEAHCAGRGVDVLGAARADVEAWRRSMEEGGLAPRTVRQRLAAIASFCAYAGVPSPLGSVRRPPLPALPPMGLSRGELTALLEAARRDGPRSHALVTLLAFTGLRISEALGAQVQDLGREGGFDVLHVEGKGARHATVALCARAVAALAPIRSGRKSGPLFATSSGHAMDRAAAWKLLRRLAQEADLDGGDDFHPHQLRHTFVSLALDEGASLRDVQLAARHADPRTTAGYDRGRRALASHPGHHLAEVV